jgi:hypothetical protein
MDEPDSHEGSIGDFGLLPPYSYVPGGPWPHPTRDARGHSYQDQSNDRSDREFDRDAYLEHWLRRGVALFDAGYYWEAHEAWENAWHALGRRGPGADLVRGLIKLAAAGVKVRERQPHGVRTHADRAAGLFAQARAAEGATQLLGFQLDWLEACARRLAAEPTPAGGSMAEPVVRVFPWHIAEACAGSIDRRD